MSRFYDHDLHIHSALSPCGDEDMTPNNIVNMAYIKGLDIIAITDHNSCKNARAVMKAGKGVIKVVPGMEVTTSEEVHTLCLFPDIESAEDMGEFVRMHMTGVKNQPEIFGRQLIMNAEDEIVGEEEELLEQKKLIKNAENILSALNAAYGLLSGNDEFIGACSALQQAEDEVSSISEFSEKITEISEILIDISDKSQDAMYEIRSAIDDFDVDINMIDEIEERLDTYYKLKRKYGGSVEAVLEYYDKAKEKLDNIEFAQEKLEKLYAEKAIIVKELEKTAQALTDERCDKFDMMAGEIQNSLAFLNMPFVKLSLNIEDKDYSADGKDQLEFYIVTNKGESPKPLAKIASGGELSRIMLAIKSVLAEKQVTDTMIFDEIDAGVSGTAALKIGKLLKETAYNRQVLCVTHSPQIAAFADTHMYIEKTTKGDATYTTVRKLGTEERVAEIARIISGDNITETAAENAREMLAAAQNS